MKEILLCFVIGFTLLQCTSTQEKSKTDFFVSFTKKNEVNPCLQQSSDRSFVCPLKQQTVKWEAKDVFNPATAVKGDTLFLLYRAEDSVGIHNGTSRIGLAYSLDGYHFQKEPHPVLFPDNDEFKKYEWEGGCEDPRLIESEDGTYFMYYSAYDGEKARLFVATSKDLRHWEKHGSVFRVANEKYVDLWTKSGAVVCREENGRMIATKIKGKYWMYWGDSNVYIATSDNLIDWHPIVETDSEKMQLDELRGYSTPFHIIFSTRKGKYDSKLVESGPPALITEQGIFFIYNSKNCSEHGDKNLAAGTYVATQTLLDKNDPTKVLHRMDKWFIQPDQDYEITGQVNHVCFVEGLAYFKDKWFLYYGTADSKIAVAESESFNTKNISK